MLIGAVGEVADVELVRELRVDELQRPARGALGMLFVHGMGMVLHHRLRWFAVGPGEEGNDLPAMLMLCFFAVMVAHWPARTAAERRGQEAQTPARRSSN